MINISNFTSEDNPSWLPAALVVPDRPTLLSGPAGTAARRPEPGTGIRALRALATAALILLSWLTAVPGRLGDRLFAANDTEAYWHDWQITRTRGGLARSYRDPRFDLLAECPKCRGAGGAADLPCLPCLGTGRVTREEVGR